MTVAAWGGPIAVPNFSFEDPDVADGAAATAIVGWSASFGGSATFSVGVHDQLNAQYAGATGDNAALPGTANGGQDAFISLVPGGATSFATLTTDTSLGTIEADTRYFLTVALGNRLDADSGQVILSFTANGSPFGGLLIAGSLIPNGTFTDFTISPTPFPAGHPSVGASLGVQLRMDAPASGPTLQGNFDNVRVRSQVPEPASTTVILAVVGIAFTRRKRRFA